MSIWTSLEQEFNAIAADTRSIPEKLEAVVGLHAKAQELTQLESQLVSVIDGGATAPEKVEQILKLVGKL